MLHFESYYKCVTERLYLAAKTHLLFSLGCQAEIPCPHYQRDSSHFKWLHEKGKERSTLYFKDDKGIEHYQSFFRSRMKVLRNGSLIIDCFTEADEGLYWCEVCFQNNWWNDSLTVVTVNKGQNYFALHHLFYNYSTAFCIQL